MTLSQEELVQKYATRGPRYTSYPTAPNFSEEVDSEDLKLKWRKATQDLSLYIHLPFCAIRCLFCGCHTIISKQTERASRYVDWTLQELDLHGRWTNLDRPLQQLALGGGTPNFLEKSDMRRLIAGVESRVAITADAERSIEIDPRAVTPDYIRMLVDLGFNRFSMGVQDFDQDVMTAVNRPQKEATIYEVVSAIKETGDIPFNFDLIYGLPRQTAETWAKSIDTVLELMPSRLAVYGYAHVPWMKKHQRVLEKYDSPDDELRGRLNQHARERLTAAGYIDIGFDHYALPSDELVSAFQSGRLHRNFMGYTTRRGLDLVGLGVSAISDNGGTYVQNIKIEKEWKSFIESGRPPWMRGIILSEDDIQRRELILDLSCNFKHEQSGLVNRYPEEMARLRGMEADGLLTIESDALSIAPRGKPFVRNICMVFDAYLKPSQSGFSRTS